MTPAYWINWAYLQGRNHYETRDPWDSAAIAAECVSSDPAEREAAVKGWQDAEAEDRGLDPHVPVFP